MKEYKILGEKDTRSGFGEGLLEAGKENPNVVALCADLTPSVRMDLFQKEFPERFIEVGIAESNMVSIASGMAIAGKVPFVGSFAAFSTGRTYDQIRQSVAYSDTNVKIAGSHAGLTLGEDGATHQTVEDLAIMRAIPGMTVLCPCDANEMELAVEALINYEKPAYMRLGRLAVETVTDQIPGYKFEIGKGAILKDGTDVTIIAVGMNVQMSLEAAQILADEGISARVVDMHTIKPLDEALVLKCAKDTGAIVTTEEANIMGGLGSAVAELIAESDVRVPVVRHGVEDCFGRSGKAPLVLEAYGITAEGIAKKAKEAIAKK